VNPTYFIGPFAPALIINPGDVDAMSTNLILYNILLPDSKISTSNLGFVDVRDVARGLVAGIKTPGRHRALLSGEWFELKDAVDYISVVRPSVKSRLPKLTPSGQTQAIVDNTSTEEALKFKVRSWRDSVLETVDALIRLEREWVDAGVDLDDTMRKTGNRA
jgi:nucleoside-diphosphate-sugar epimerase